MAEHSDPVISIIIVNHNGMNCITGCLSSVLKSDFRDFEVIFVDNASKDDSIACAQKFADQDTRVRILPQTIPLGPANGRNRGIEAAKGEYIVFLDNDTEVTAPWLTEMLKVLENNKNVGCVQSKLLLPDKKTLDTCGHYMSFLGFPFELGSNEIDHGQYNTEIEIFGARSAAMCVLRDALVKAGVFDSDYFMHSEETDLCWRIWLAGYRIVYVPGSVVYHKRSGSASKAARRMQYYEGAKNCTKTVLKNCGLLRLLYMAPLHLASWLCIAILLCFRFRFNDAYAIIRGLAWDCTHIVRIYSDRKIIQEMRVIPDKELFHIMHGKLGVFGFLIKAFRWLSKT
ncbi:MAG TPA: glycosyltransferase family 2 protein [Candidatus Omnitrophota bacterium]|nr:glycosyltransferase family 2 protein [Candidatus Omnitrophota bacterium]